MRARLVRRAASVLSLLVTCILTTTVPAIADHGRKAQAGDNPVPLLIRQMAGTWDVRQRMWPGAGAQPINLSPAIARRHIIGGEFLEEVMEAVPAVKQESFTRDAFLNYNPVNQQYEYFSIDTRAPQMMFEKSYESGIRTKLSGDDVITLYGGSFVAPQWGKFKNAAFRYRIEIGAVEGDRQVIRLYLTPQSAESPKEFLAFEYIYTRQH
jgi:hypothetical protein